MRPLARGVAVRDAAGGWLAAVLAVGHPQRAVGIEQQIVDLVAEQGVGSIEVLPGVGLPIAVRQAAARSHDLVAEITHIIGLVSAHPQRGAVFNQHGAQRGAGDEADLLGADQLPLLAVPDGQPGVAGGVQVAAGRVEGQVVDGEQREAGVAGVAHGAQGLRVPLHQPAALRAGPHGLPIPEQDVGGRGRIIVQPLFRRVGRLEQEAGQLGDIWGRGLGGQRGAGGRGFGGGSHGWGGRGRGGLSSASGGGGGYGCAASQGQQHQQGAY